MNLTFKAAVAALILAGCFPGSISAGPFEDGLDAARRADYATVLRLWTPLAEQGDARAQWRLGLMYANGRGVSQDDAAAIRWYRAAAEQGDPVAQSNLGLMYAVGRGVPQDYVRAYMWFNLAAANGDEVAERNRDKIAPKMTPGQIAEALALEYDSKPTDLNSKPCEDVKNVEVSHRDYRGRTALVDAGGLGDPLRDINGGAN
jgi:TPR repeat protein